MKKIILTFICFLSITIASNAEAFQNEPNGFRDLYWGESLQEVKNSGYDVKYGSYYAKENAVTYETKLENKVIGGVSTIGETTMYLNFWNNKLYKVVIGIDFNNNDKTGRDFVYMLLKDSMTVHFGEPTSYDVYPHWKGNVTNISLWQLENKPKYSILIFIDSIQLQQSALEDAASKGW